MRILLAIFILLNSFACQPAYADINSVVSKAIKTGQITRDDARNVYLLRERTWHDGTKVMVYRMPLRDKMHIQFVRDVLGMSPTQFDQEWQRLINAGLAPNIGEVQTEREMMRTIEDKHNAVGYLSHEYLLLNGGGRDVAIIRIVD